MESVARSLKRFREAAIPVITVREMATRLHLDHSTYAHYENEKRFKKPYLPIELARSVANILVDHGIDPVAVLALAGLGADEAEAPTLTPRETRVLDDFRDLSPDEQKFVESLLAKMTGRQTVPQTIHSGRKTYGPQPKEDA